MYLVCCVSFLYTYSELDLSEQLINLEEPDPIYDLFAVTVSASYSTCHIS